MLSMLPDMPSNQDSGQTNPHSSEHSTCAPYPLQSTPSHREWRHTLAYESCEQCNRNRTTLYRQYQERLALVFRPQQSPSSYNGRMHRSHQQEHQCVKACGQDDQRRGI